MKLNAVLERMSNENQIPKHLYIPICQFSYCLLNDLNGGIKKDNMEIFIQQKKRITKEKKIYATAAHSFLMDILCKAKSCHRFVRKCHPIQELRKGHG